MKRTVFGVVAGFLFMAAPAQADIVEVRGKGMMTGSVVSQDEKEMVFKDNDGRTLRFEKSDILFFDQEIAPKDAVTGARRDYFGKVKNFFKGAPYWFDELRAWTDSMTKKFREFAGQPLDRSNAQKKADTLAKTMDEANKHQAELLRRQRKIQQGLNRQSTGSGSSSDDSNSGFNGTFGKL